MVLKYKIAQIKKRDGRIVSFDQNRITSAIYKAMQATGEGDLARDPIKVSMKVVEELTKHYSKDHVPTVEEIQDIVEESLILMDFPKVAKSYILYRQERALIREKKKIIPEHVKELVTESKKYFRNAMSEFIYYRTYSRWIEEEGRRETWIESVNRYIAFMKENIGNKIDDKEYEEIRQAVLKQESMPSMRLLWSAGKAARATNVSAYNCSYIAPTKLRDFSEIMYLLMCGTGVGFSVESQTVQKLPLIKHQAKTKASTYVIEDSKEGWGNALFAGLKTWFSGKDIKFDYSKLRPAGARLKTMGGRSSGPEPLKNLLDFSRATLLSRQGKRLTNLNVHDIICKIGEVVVMGGVRRSALISLSDLDDDAIRLSKTDQFFINHPQRQLANNSAVYTKKPSASEFMEEWLSLAKSGTGERGIFNREGLESQLPERRWKKFKKHWATAGTNPCGEIVLRSKQFCNLTEVVARTEDTEESLLKKAKIAAILGTYQSTLTHFPYLSKEWKENCEEERLLGVSVTGQWDSKLARNEEMLKKMKEMVIKTNGKYSKLFSVNPSTCATCVKPSGTVSQLVDASSGMHPRYAPFYIRRVRISAGDPLFQMLKEQKFPYYPEVGQLEQSATTYVLEFPVKSPKTAVFRNDIHAIDQLEYWKKVKQNYTEHNPSVTVYIGENEWIKAADWLYENWSILGGLSFLPRTDFVYKLSPYEEITEEQYDKLAAKLPEIDFAQIVVYEKDDETMGSKELACVGGMCEVDSIATTAENIPTTVLPS